MGNKIEFKVTRNELLHALSKIVRVVPDKSSIPAYTYILFEVKNEALTLTGNNQDIQIETSIDLVEQSSDVAFCLDKSIVSVLKTLSEQPLTFSIIEKVEATFTIINVEVTHASGKVEFQAIEACDYVRMNCEDGKTFTIPVSKLKRGLDKTKKFAGNDPMKPTQSAVYLDMKPDGIVFVGTMGNILSKFKDKSLTNIEAPSFIFSIGAVNVTSNILGETNSEDATINSGATTISINLGSIVITSRLVEGRYPNYDSVFPESNPISFTMDSKHLSNVASRLLIAANATYGTIKIEASGNEVCLSSKDTLFGKSAEERIATSCEGTIKIGAKGSQLEDMMSIVDGNAILSFSDPLRPIIVTPETNEEDTELTVLAMPLKLD